MTASPANFSTVPPVELDLLAHRDVELLQLHANALRVAFACERGRPDEVGEENRDELALPAPC
jgi:hypothetical protein